MSEAVIDDVVTVLPPLLQAIETLGFVARNFHPPSFDRVMETAGQPDEDLSAVRPRLANWPAEFTELQNSLETASDAALAAFAGLRAVRAGQGDITTAFRALRQLPRAEEALYPLAAKFPPVSSFFLNPELCEDADLLARLAMPANQATGIMHDHNEPKSRGGFSIYVPEYYTPDRAWPLVVALHGGSGNGRGFLWSWLRALELVARRPQFWRHPGRADRNRQRFKFQKHLGIDGRGHRHAQPRPYPGFGAGTLERRSYPAAADRHERWRHVLLRHRA